jgi:hypothetical protein
MANTYQQVSVVLGGGGTSTATAYPDAGSFPSTGTAGQMAFDSSTGSLYIWNDTTISWNLINNVTVTTQYKPEDQRTLDGTDIANGYILLNEAPLSKTKTRVGIIGGIFATYGVDFVVTTDNGGKRLSWSSLGLQSLLEVGDILIITYN